MRELFKVIIRLLTQNPADAEIEKNRSSLARERLMKGAGRG